MVRKKCTEMSTVIISAQYKLILPFILFYFIFFYQRVGIRIFTIEALKHLTNEQIFYMSVSLK